METNGTVQIDIAALKQQLRLRKTTKGLFRLPLTESQTYQALMAAVQVEVEYRGMTYEPSAELVDYVTKAAKWLYDGNKFGLMLLGQPGNGKTTLMRAICSLLNYFEVKDPYGERVHIRTVSATELARINRDNYEVFKKICNEPMLAIDDLGQEPNEILDYGNVATPAVDLLCHRYNEQLFTIVTTNLGKRSDDPAKKSSTLRGRYGDRIADRFNEMMSFIVFKNKSYRR